MKLEQGRYYSRFSVTEICLNYPNIFLVFNVTESEVVWMTRHNVIRKGDQDTPYNFVVRLRGIPFSATNDDVKEFFSGTLFHSISQMLFQKHLLTVLNCEFRSFPR